MLIIQGSHRKSGTTAAVVGKLEKELNVSVIHLSDLDLAHFSYVGTTDDDFVEVIRAMIIHQEVIWATPVYWYTMSGMMKVLLDRISDLLKWDKDLGRKLRGLKMHVVSVSGHNDAPEQFPLPFKMSADYLGMDFGQYMHVWGAEGVLDPACLPVVQKFCHKILDTTINV